MPPTTLWPADHSLIHHPPWPTWPTESTPNPPIVTFVHYIIFQTMALCQVCQPTSCESCILYPGWNDGMKYEVEKKKNEAMENVKDLDQDLSKANVTISLPKFKIESSYKLKKSLNKLGLETLFDPSQADLTGLNENPKDKSLFVDEVVQKAFIEGY